MSKQFDPDLLKRLASVEEIEIETRPVAHNAVHRTTIWVVVDGGDVYVRSVRGATARWYRELMANPTAALYLEGRRIPVHAVPATDERSIARVSDGYLRKYRRSPYVHAIVRDEILPTTIRLEPA